MKLSIITINLNNKSGFLATAESVIQQTFKDFEWIVIDGGSYDGSKELIEKYSDRMAYWVSEPDNGIYNAMNKGILAAKGDYCLFLNSGDYFVDNEVLNKVFTNDFDEDVIYGDQLWKYTDRIEKYTSADKVTLYTLIFSNIQHSGTSIIRRSLFKKYGLYDEDLLIVSDWKWFLYAIGLGDATTRHINVIMSVFDMNGISVKRTDLAKKETTMILNEVIPPKALIDYNNYRQLQQDYLDVQNRIRNSRAYKLGYLLLAPFKILRRVSSKI